MLYYNFINACMHMYSCYPSNDDDILSLNDAAINSYDQLANISDAKTNSGWCITNHYYNTLDQYSKISFSFYDKNMLLIMIQQIVYQIIDIKKHMEQ